MQAKLAPLLVNVFVVLISSLIGLVVLDIATRKIYLEDGFVFRNFAADPVNQIITNFAVNYDPVIGYIGKEGYRDNNKNSFGEFGTRMNRKLEPNESFPPAARGAILAVGDSFTYGSEVFDHESWPAYLEQKLGHPVVNGGAGGYGIDQIYLRTRQLVDQLEPKLIVASFIPNCVQRNEMSVNGGFPKPYFSVSDGELELQNTPVPKYQPGVKHVGIFRAIFGYSFFIDWAMARLGWSHYWRTTAYEYRFEDVDRDEVSCLLMHKFQALSVEKDIPVIILAQYAGIQVANIDSAIQAYRIPELLDCAMDAGLSVVDSYDGLLKKFETEPKSMWKLYVKRPEDREVHMGHMSAAGNEFTAELIASRIRRDFSDIIK